MSAKSTVSKSISPNHIRFKIITLASAGNFLSGTKLIISAKSTVLRFMMQKTGSKMVNAHASTIKSSIAVDSCAKHPLQKKLLVVLGSLQSLLLELSSVQLH